MACDKTKPKVLHERSIIPTAAPKAQDAGASTPVNPNDPTSIAHHGVTGDTSTINGLIAVQTDPATGAISYAMVDPAQSVVKLADRFYVASVLKQTFGPAAGGLVGSLVATNASAFGAPCDPYGRPGVNDCAVSPSLSQAPTNPVSTSSRAAFMTRTCEGIAVLDPAVVYAAAQITSADIHAAPPAATDVAAAYGLFFPQVKPTDAEAAALSGVVQATMAQANAQPLSAWRHLLLTLCLSPRWHVL